MSKAARQVSVFWLFQMILVAQAPAQSDIPDRYRVHTFAGRAGPIGEHIPARRAYLSSPTDLTVGPDGSVYFIERASFVIRKVSRRGIISTVAGNGISGVPSGDGGPARSAQIGTYSDGLVIDSRGNLFFADSNQELRKVNTEGIISAFLPAGSFSINAIAIDTADRIYVATSDNRILRVTPEGSVSDFASIDASNGIAVDHAGTVYAAQSDYRIQKIGLDGSVTPVAGNGTFGFGAENAAALSSPIAFIPGALTTGPDGTLYFAEFNRISALNPLSRVRKLTMEGTLVTVAGGRGPGETESGVPATSALVGTLFAITSDVHGNLFLADIINHLIDRVDPSGTLHIVAGRTRFAGDGGRASESLMNYPIGITADANGNVFVSDTVNRRIRKISDDRIISTVAGSGDFGDFGDELPAEAASFEYVDEIAMMPDGSVLMADFTENRVRRLDPNGYMHAFAGDGQLGGAGDGGPALNAQLQNPYGVAVGLAGEVYISESSGQRIRKVSTDGTISTIAGTGKPGFTGDGGPAINAQLWFPRALAVDTFGNLYVADQGNVRIRRISPGGVITTVAGDGQVGWTGDGGPATSASLYSPWGVFADASGSVLFTGVAPDGRGGYVRRLRPDGRVETIAGSQPGLGGDGGYATNAEFNFPDELTMVSGGRILVTERWSNRVRVLVPVRSESSQTVDDEEDR